MDVTLLQVTNVALTNCASKETLASIQQPLPQVAMDTSFHGFIKEINGPFREAPHKGYWVANDIKAEDDCIHLEQRLKR